MSECAMYVPGRSLFDRLKVSGPIVPAFYLRSLALSAIAFTLTS